MAAIVATQVVNVFLCRSERRSLFHFPLWENRLILAGIAVELSLMAWISYSHFGNLIFGTAPLPAKVWLFVAPFPLAMAAIEEIRKWMVNR